MPKRSEFAGLRRDCARYEVASSGRVSTCTEIANHICVPAEFGARAAERLDFCSLLDPLEENIRAPSVPTNAGDHRGWQIGVDSREVGSLATKSSHNIRYAAFYMDGP